jgi:hypothetical protein
MPTDPDPLPDDPALLQQMLRELHVENDKLRLLIQRLTRHQFGRAITPLTAGQRRDLMEIVDDRRDRASTIVTSQVPVERWHEHIGNPTIADAVLDRLVPGAHRLELKGESMRKLRAAKDRLDEATVQ